MKKSCFHQNWTCNGVAVTLPHDAMIHQARIPGHASGSAQAYFPGGCYVYEKTFQRPDQQHVVFQFESVYKNAKVFLNGKKAGGCNYGYLPFFVCADPYLVDGENTIRVECDNLSQPDSRWYAGAGIYRPVWMWVGPEKSIEPEQIKVHTLSVSPATIHVSTDCDNAMIEILDGEMVVATAQGAEADIVIPDAKLWDAETPNLYTCRVTAGADAATVTFGIRTIQWNNKGFYINGKSTLLRGGCVHHDQGILGAATYDESEWRRVRIMKDAGFNALRSAHNPCSRAMMEACDHYGMYIMDEAWDMWYQHKNPFDYATCWEENYSSDLTAIVNRDYNHPSVVMYSIGNEVTEPARAEGVQKTKEMVDLLHQLDPTRPVTCALNLVITANAGKNKTMSLGDKEKKPSEQGPAMNSTVFNMIANIVGVGMNRAGNSKWIDQATSPCLDVLDIAGYNYAAGRYPLDGDCHPDRLIVGSETFHQGIVHNWNMVKKYDYLIGDFMWTAWDYLGEVGLGAWAYTKDGASFSKPYPWLLADTGAFDILGTPNGELYRAQAVWGQLNSPMIGVQPVNHPQQKPIRNIWRGTNAMSSWSWQGCEGNPAVIEVFSDADWIELLCNGKSLGKKKVKDCIAKFKTKYHSGKLEAIAYDKAGKECSRSSLESATGKTHICVFPETEHAQAGDLVYVDLAIVGENGIVESNDDRKLKVIVDGGELLAFGSANPRTEERFDSGEYTTYYGMALAAIRVEGDTAVTVTDGCDTATAAIKIV